MLCVSWHADDFDPFPFCDLIQSFFFYTILSKRISFHNFPYLVSLYRNINFSFCKGRPACLFRCTGKFFFSLKPLRQEASSSFLTWEKQLIFSKHFLFVLWLCLFCYIHHVLQLIKTEVLLCGFRAHSINLGTALSLSSLKQGYCVSQKGRW